MLIQTLWSEWRPGKPIKIRTCADGDADSSSQKVSQVVVLYGLGGKINRQHKEKYKLGADVIIASF